ncbi:hypothetical protein GZL_00934 [Streptomyces sp. 769]|nr:hypothetical protein GZL_00934 [Streptomyces sp. 769]
MPTAFDEPGDALVPAGVRGVLRVTGDDAGSEPPRQGEGQRHSCVPELTILTGIDSVR